MRVQRIYKFSYFALLLTIMSVISLFFPSINLSEDSHNSAIKEAQEYFNKGIQLEKLFPDSAVYYYQKGLVDLENIKQNKNASLLKIKLLSKIGSVFHLQSKYSFASDYFTKALNESQAILNDSLIAESNFNIAEIELENGSYAHAIESYYKARELYNKIKYSDGIFWSDIGLGIVFRELGNSQQSEKHYKLAIETGKKENKKKFIAISYNNLGNLYKQIGEYQQALEYLQVALNSFEKLGEEKFISDCLEGIGEIYYEINNYERAVQYFNKSTRISEILGDNYRLLSKYANTANAYAGMGENEKALMYFSKTIELAQSIGDKARLSEVLIMVSDFYRKNGNLDNALLNLNKSLIISQEVCDTVSIAKGYNSLSEIYFLLKNYAEAYRNALKSYQIASQKNLIKTVAESSLNIFRTLEIKGNYKDALFYFKIHKKTLDILLNSEKLKILEDTEAKFNVERIEREKLELKNDALSQEKILQSRNTQLTFMGILLLISMSGFSVYLFRKRKERRESSENSLRMKRKIDLLNSQINERNRELTSKALMISQNNEVLKGVVNSIENYLKNEKSDKNELKRLKIQLQEIYEEKSWDDFLQHFELVHPQFYKNLIAKCENLTPTEQKICAFLKMNLNTKEISHITGQSVKAIEVMRTRIRKKMEIPHEDNLNTIIQTL